MRSYEETKAAIMGLLATFGNEPRSLYDIGVPLVDRGFAQDPIVNALFELSHEGVIELLPGNALRVLKLPAPRN